MARMTSLWIDRAPHIETDPFEQNARYDVVVVGAGLTGLTTALLLARAGQRALRLLPAALRGEERRVVPLLRRQ